MDTYYDKPMDAWDDMLKLSQMPKWHMYPEKENKMRFEIDSIYKKISTSLCKEIPARVEITYKFIKE